MIAPADPRGQRWSSLAQQFGSSANLFQHITEIERSVRRYYPGMSRSGDETEGAGIIFEKLHLYDPDQSFDRFVQVVLRSFFISRFRHESRYVHGIELDCFPRCAAEKTYLRVHLEDWICALRPPEQIVFLLTNLRVFMEELPCEIIVAWLEAAGCQRARDVWTSMANRCPTDRVRFAAAETGLSQREAKRVSDYLQLKFAEDFTDESTDHHKVK